MVALVVLKLKHLSTNILSSLNGVYSKVVPLVVLTLASSFPTSTCSLSLSEGNNYREREGGGGEGGREKERDGT